MNWVCKKKQMFIVRKQQLVCLSLMLLLLLLILSQSKSLSLADDHVSVQRGRRLNKFKSKSSSSPTTKVLRSHDEKRSHGFKNKFAGRNGNGHVIGDDDDDQDDIFGADKRRVHTGPNPLHNR